MKNILHIESSNFEDFPLGGTLSFARQFIENVSGNFYLVGLGNEYDQIGKWFKKDINGQLYNFFAIGFSSKVYNSKLPSRLVVYLMLRRYLHNIFSDNNLYDIVFTQTPEFVFLLSNYKWKKIVFCFAGLGNSVGNSKFKYLRFLGGMYESLLFKNLNSNFDIILAAADSTAIRNKENEFKLSRGTIVSFPTRFDPSIYNQKSFQVARKDIGVDIDVNVFVSVGRLSYIKGWRDLIDSYRLFILEKPNSLLIFIGDGEDKIEMENYACNEIVNKTILLVGRKCPSEISTYLNASNVFVMFSLIEGWPTSMTEALACGKNIVTSDVSGSNEMVDQNINGFIVKNRNVEIFADSMSRALELPNPNKISLEKSKLYSSETLNSDFFNIMKL